MSHTSPTNSPRSTDHITEPSATSRTTTATTHYALTADTAGILAQLGGRDEGNLRDRVVWHLWLDDQDRPRQLQADLGEKASLHLEVTDLGEPVTIEAPPANQVQKMPGS